MICVDSSVIISLLRAKRTAATLVLQRLETEKADYVIPLICAQEVLQGASSRGDWNLLMQYFTTQNLIAALRPETYFEAASIFYDLRRRGITVRSTIDCLIAQMCLESDYYLLHDDSDFRKIQLVRKLRFAC